MSTKISNNNQKKKKTNPANRKYYIGISIMVAVIIAIAGFFIYESVSKNDGGVKKVQFTMTDGQTFIMEVYPDVAPVTAKNFINLVEDGFYNGLTFHRVIDGFMAQGGAYDPVNQMNDPVAPIKGEFASNGFNKNRRSHVRGTISMARGTEPNTASSQFFICNGDARSSLDGNYAAFGYTVEGLSVIDKITAEVFPKTAAAEYYGTENHVMWQKVGDGVIINEADKPVIKYIKVLENYEKSR